MRCDDKSVCSILIFTGRPKEEVEGKKTATGPRGLWSGFFRSIGLLMPGIRKDRWRFSVTLLVGVAVVLALGCGDRCSDPPPPRGMAGAHALAEAVPSDVRMVAFTEHTGQLWDRMDGVIDEFPLEFKGEEKRNDWQRVGALVDGPGVVFWEGEQWVVMGWLDPEREISFEQWPGEGKVDERKLEEGKKRVWFDDEGRWTKWLSTDGRRIAAGWSVQEDAQALGASLWSLEEGEHWEVDERQRQWEVDDDPEDEKREDQIVAHGVMDGARLIQPLGGEGQAGELLRQLADDLGVIYWSVASADDGRWVIGVETPGGGENAGHDLGQARDRLPGLGGLIRRGSPAVIRLSAEPERVVEFLRSHLDATERMQADMAMQVFREQLSVDLEEDVIANMTGQAAIVVLGFEDHFFELEGMERWAALVRLDATRGAVVIPFEDREAMESVLNSFTQLTKGRLRRQATERAIQYARFDDGALKWAAILGDEHLIFVDSAVALDHVSNWERSPGPLDDIFVERGVDSMLDKSRGMGAYVDVATLRSLLREGGDDRWEAWLKPLEAVRLVTDVDGERERTEIDIWPSGRSDEEEE